MTVRMKIAALFVLIPLAVPAPAMAAASDWYEAEGARVRLVSEEAAGPDGALRAALEIVLDPGWKTYWRDPGEAGIAPSIDVSTATNVTGATLGFPAPAWHGSGAEAWAGYAGSVSLPITLRLEDPNAFTAVDADVFLGVCRDICVPVQTRLSVMPGGDASLREPTVEAAFAALPAPADAAFGVTGATTEGDRLAVEVAVPQGGTEAELFVAAPTGWVLRKPERAARGGAFEIQVAARPDGAADPGFDYTLVAGGRAVQGSFRLR